MFAALILLAALMKLPIWQRTHVATFRGDPGWYSNFDATWKQCMDALVEDVRRNTQLDITRAARHARRP
jgi:hypothetical protein